MTEHERPADFARAWGELERDLEAHPSPDFDRRLASKLEGPRPPPTLAWASAAAVVGAAAYLLLAGAPEPPAPSAQRSAEVRFSAARCAPERLSATLDLPIGCGLTLPGEGVELYAESPAKLVHTDRGVRLRAGVVRFEIAPRRSSPFVVLVSGGRIEVHGTVFTVTEAGPAGRVELVSGRIDLVDPAGRRRTLEPGESARWPRRLSVEELDRAVAEVSRLRRAGEAQQAAARIEALDVPGLDPGAAEVLSYERGLILQDDLREARAACAHWRRHATRFGDGRYAERVSAALEACSKAGNSSEARR